MAVLSDKEIRRRLELLPGNAQRLVIEPFCERTKEPGKVSHGLQPGGFDLRLGRNFFFYNPQARDSSGTMVVDPCDFNEGCGNWVRDFLADEVYLEPGAAVLAECMEYIEVPADCTVRIMCKSTYARCFIHLNTTPADPGWKGVLTVEIKNDNVLPVKLHVGQGIGQVIFEELTSPADRPYDGSYQGQTGVTLPRV